LLRLLPGLVWRSLLLLIRTAWGGCCSFFRRAACPASIVSRTAAGPPCPLPLFFYSQVAWDDVWQRPQEFALRLARERPTIFFSPVQIHRLPGISNVARRPGGSNRPTCDLDIITAPILPGEYKSRLIRRLNAVLLRAEVRRRVGDGAAFTFLTNSPFAEPLRRAFRWRATVYDVIDDYAAFDWAPPEAARWHDALVANCDAVFTGTHALLEKVQPLRPEARYVPSAVDFDLFYRPNRDAGPPPEELRDLRGPIIGYTGSISDRLDRDLIRRAAERYPQAQFVLIGPVHGSFGPPPQAPNLHYLGLKPHEVLPAYTNRFDLALLPFRQTPGALATNPVKTLEYLASGCVVLSTAIPDVIRYYDGVVIVARSDGEFLDRMGELLAGDHADRRARGVEVARGASWDAMARQAKEIIASAEARRAQSRDEGRETPDAKRAPRDER